MKDLSSSKYECFLCRISKHVHMLPYCASKPQETGIGSAGGCGLGKEKTGAPVEHPLLDKVRECSANPEAASDFFRQILHPYNVQRLSIEAYRHPYVATAFQKMMAYKHDHSQSGTLVQRLLSSCTPLSSDLDCCSCCVDSL